MRIAIEVYDAGGFSCLINKCNFTRTCANHLSAGDFRAEDGFTPEIEKRDGGFYCATADQPIRDSDDLSVFNDYPNNIDKLGHGAMTMRDLDTVSQITYEI